MAFPIYQYLEETYRIHLTAQQRDAVETVGGPVLLLAVPGAGKTTVMVTRIANMVQNHGIAPRDILTITFSRAGAADMQARYRALFGNLEGSNGEPSFSTIHSFCFRVIRSYCKATGGTPPELISPKQKRDILRTIYKTVNNDFLSDDLEEELTSNLSYLKNAMLKENQVSELETEIANLWELYREYSSMKKSSGLMDYDDMLSYALTVFRKYPDILGRYRDWYRYICVDEAQDTSKLQHAVIQLLAAPVNNLFLVGDEDQSIYRFRGAAPEHLLEFPKRYPNAKILKMEENFRSMGNIVERANQFISLNKERYPKQMFTHREKGNPIQTPKLSDLSDQYHIAIDTYLDEPGTTAVIYRNNLSAIPLADILDRNDVDFTIKDHKAPFRNNYVVGDVLAFFDLSFDQSNLQAFSRIFYKTSGFLRRSLLMQMNTSPLLQGETYFDRMAELCGDKAKGDRIRYISSMVDSLRKQKPVKALDCILHSIGYLDFLEYSSGPGFSLQVQKLSVLQNLATRVKSVEELLDRIDEMDAVVSLHSQRHEARLILTTAHSAKGLEFDSVVLLDAVDDVFPCHSAVDKYKQGMEQEMEEEARLFYVACTRAKKRLVIPYANFSQNNSIVPSRFLFRLTQDPIKAETGQGGEISLYLGLKVVHSVFGEGQVVGVNRERRLFTVYFGKSGTRTLTMDILKKGLLSAKE